MRRAPTAVKALRGTLRRDRTNPREPKPKPGALPAGRHWPAPVRMKYRTLVRSLRGLGVLTRVDGPVLYLTAVALVEVDTHTTTIDSGGSTYETATEAGARLIRQHPAVALRADAWRRALSGLVQLGLSPLARPKVEALSAALADATGRDAFEAFQARRWASADPHERVAARRAQRQTKDPARFFTPPRGGTPPPGEAPA